MHQPPGLDEVDLTPITRTDPLDPSRGDLSGFRTSITVSLEAYEDLGATLVDDPQEGLLVTSHLFLTGEGSFRTVTRSNVSIPRVNPTLPGRPWLVRYSVREDDAWSWRDLANPLLREIVILCPQGEQVCEDQDNPGSTYCSVEGFCIVFTDSDETDMTTERYPPEISLRGSQDRVQIDARTLYEICPLDGSDPGIPCERGAEAFDIIGTDSGNQTKDLTDDIKLRCRFTPAVSDEAGQLGPLVDFSDGLAACGFSTATPGVFQLQFEVTNSAGFTSRVEKRVRIMAVCPTGDVLCSAGVCAESPAQCALFDGSSPDTSEDAETQSATEEDEEIAAPAPWIGLRVVPGREEAADSILIPEGLEYKGCDEEGAQELCEPGADSRDETGDISKRVWACPQSPLMPANCLASPSECPFNKYGFYTAGLSYCQFEIPEGQEDFLEGDSFEIPFVALANNGRTSEKRRFVTVGRRCPNDDQPFWCNAPERGMLESRCVALPCDQWRAIGAPDSAGDNDTPGFGSTAAAAEDVEVNDESTVSNPDNDDFPAAPGGGDNDGGGGRRLLSRSLQQVDEEEDEEVIPTVTNTVNLIFGFSAGTTPDNIAWRNDPLAPCQPGGDPDNVCGTAAIDATGSSVRLSVSTPCTDPFNAYPTYKEYVAAVRRTRYLEASPDEECASDLCSPSAADRGQCPPGKYIVRYEAVDSQKRESAMNLIFRIENGARHKVQILGTLPCELEAEINSGRPILFGMPYLKALGLNLDSIRRVKLLGERVRISRDPVHPGNADMPPLCEALFQMELQVGCTPGEPGFKEGPTLDETEEQWCPCTIDWDPTYLGAGDRYAIDPTRTYPIVPDSTGRPVYGPLISYSLQEPTGVFPGSPSPYCSAVTPPSDNAEARLKREGAAGLSNFEDASNSLLAYMDRLSDSIEDILDNKHNETDSQIEQQWRELLFNFAEVAGIRTDSLQQFQSQLQVLDPAALELVSLNEEASVLTSGQTAGFSDLSNVAGFSKSLPNMQRVGQEPLPDVSGVAASESFECVENERGGTDTRFYFVVGGNGTTQVPEEEPTDAVTASLTALGMQPVLNRRMLLDSHTWSGYPIKMEGASNPAAPVSGEEQDLYGTERIVGIRGNQVLAGAMFMQERRAPTDLAPGGARYSSICVSDSLASDLAAECLDSRIEAAEANVAYRDTQEASNPSGRVWIGVDPAFVATGPMFDPSVSSAPEGWYNTSEGSVEINRFGIPHGFESAPVDLPGLPGNSRDLVYPVMVDINAGNEQTTHILDFMKQGHYFDRMATKHTQFKIVSFSLDLQVFGYMIVDAHWNDAGLVETFFDVQALESKDYTGEGLEMEGMRNRLATDVVLLAFVAAYTLSSLLDIVFSTKAKARRKRTWLALQNVSATRFALPSSNNDSSGKDSPASQRDGEFVEMPSNESGSEATFGSLDNSLLANFDDSQVNEHPIPKEQQRAIKFSRNSIRSLQQQDSLARRSWLSRSSIGSLGSRMYHGMKKILQHPEERVYRSTMNPFWIFYEVVTCSFLLLGLGLMLWYAFGLQPEEAPTERRIKVYDSFFAPARPFFLNRILPEQRGVAPGSNNGTQNTNVTEALGVQGLDISTPSPGQYGRWKAGEEDARGLSDTAQMFEALDYMVLVRTGYTLCFAAAMVMLLVRLIVQASFQPRLSLIAGTLMLSAAEICYFVFILVVCGALLAMSMNIVFGANAKIMHTLSGAMGFVFEGVLLGGDQGTDAEEEAMEFLREESIAPIYYSSAVAFDTNIATMGLAATFISIRPLVFIYMFVIVMTILATPYATLKEGVRNAPGVQRDVFNLVYWIWKTVTHREPDNKSIKRLIKALLRESKSNKTDMKLSSLSSKLSSKSKEHDDRPPDTGSKRGSQKASLKASKAQKSMDELDWASLHSLVHDGHGASTSTFNASGRFASVLAPAHARQRSSVDCIAPGDTLPMERLSKSAQLKAWVQDLRIATKLKSLSTPASPRHTQESAIVHDDLESGQTPTAVTSEGQGLAPVQKELGGSPSMAKRMASAKSSNPFQDIDFEALKQQIEGLLASHRQDDRELATRMAQSMSVVFGTNTQAFSLKTSLLAANRHEAAQPRQPDWLDRQGTLLQRVAGNLAHGLLRGFSARHPAPDEPQHTRAAAAADADGAPALETVGEDRIAEVPAKDGKTSTCCLIERNGSWWIWTPPPLEMSKVVNDHENDDSTPVPVASQLIQDNVSVQEPTVSLSLRSVSISASEGKAEPSSPSLVAIMLPKDVATMTHKDAAHMVEQVVELTLEAHTVLQEVQAACKACEQMATSVRALLHNKNPDWGRRA